MIGRVAAASLFLLAGVAPAAADAASEALLRDFVAWVDSSNEWSASVSIVRSEGSDTYGEGLVFTRDKPRVAISVETLRLSELQARQGGGFTASEIEMTGGAVLTEMMEAKIPSGEVQAVVMPSLAGVTLDPKHLMTSFARFYTLAAEGSLNALSIPEVALTQRQPTPGATELTEVLVVYKDMTVSEMKDGVLLHQEMGPISISSSVPPSEKFDLAIDRIVADRVDIGAFAHILDETAYRDGRGDNIWRPLISRAAYTGLTGTGADGATFKVDEVAIENVDGRQPKEPFTDVWDRMMDPDLAEEARNDLAIEALTTMFAAWRVGTIRFDGIGIEAPSDNTHFSLDGVTLTGWSNAGFDSFLLDNLRADSASGFLSLRALEMAGFVSPDIEALMRFAALEKGADPENHAGAIKEAFSALPRLAHFSLSDVVAGKSEADSGSLTNFSIDLGSWNEIFAGSTDVRIEGLNIPRRLLELDADTAAILDTLGYDNLVIGMGLSDRWDPEAGTDDATWTFSMQDAGDLEFAYSLTGLTMDWLMRATAAAAESEDSNAALLAMLGELRVASARLSVTDRSLLDRAFAVAAKKQGLTVEGSAYREQMRAALPFLISAAVPAEIAKMLSTPLQNFLGGGQRLLAEAIPPTPLGVIDLMGAMGDPSALPTLLNLQLTSEAAPQ